MKQARVWVILSEGFEEIEALTPVDVLRRAGVDVVMASLSERLQVRGAHGIEVVADALFSSLLEADDAYEISALVLPGGMGGVEGMLKHALLLDYIREIYRREVMVAAICAAPMVLDHLGILEASHFVCHPGVVSLIGVQGASFEDWKLRGRILTGRGAGAAMSWSLELARLLQGDLAAGVRDGLTVIDS